MALRPQLHARAFRGEQKQNCSNSPEIHAQINTTHVERYGPHRPANPITLTTTSASTHRDP
ncbi:MAG: hypothetical protein GY847_28465 [Proteobacteria bacterium]|nr:hypothetical protein [Pseudomonadota bacterium]